MITLTNTQNPWANLVLSMLSVNNYPMEKVIVLFDKLEENGLFDISNLAKWSLTEIFYRLEASGYTRGDFIIGLLSARLLSQSNLAENIDINEQILRTGTKEQITSLLAKVTGVGPKVIDTYLVLREN